MLSTPSTLTGIRLHPPPKYWIDWRREARLYELSVPEWMPQHIVEHGSHDQRSLGQRNVGGGMKEMKHRDKLTNRESGYREWVRDRWKQGKRERELQCSTTDYLIAN